jgi:predicted enzyme related to lactoylglutathione lyase
MERSERWPPVSEVPSLRYRSDRPDDVADFYAAVSGARLEGGRLHRDGRTVADVAPTAEDGTSGFVPVLHTPSPERLQAAIAASGGASSAGVVRHPALGRLEVASTDARDRSPGWPAPAGHLSWIQLNTRDASASAVVLAETLGWYAEDADNPSYTYWMLLDDAGAQRAGLMAIDERSGDVEPGWQVYLAAGDADGVDRAAAAATEAGGTVLVPPTDLRVRRFTVLADPSGSVVGIDAVRQGRVEWDRRDGT